MIEEEEMARLFIINRHNLRKDISIHDIEDNYEMSGEFYVYLAGLKVGRPVWHKVVDGDLPPDRHNVLSEKGDVVLMKDMKWYEYSPNYDNILLRNFEEPKYWCEIPTYTEV